METRDQPALQRDPAEAVTWSTPRLRPKVLGISLLAAFVCYGFFQWVFWPVKVVGDSMRPNFQHGKRYFVNKLAYWSARPQRGDVVALHASGGEVYIKRVIGLPGDQLDFIGGRVFVNGEELHEPYVSGRTPPKPKGLRVPGGQYYVMGDNRTTSIAVAVMPETIIGRVMVRPPGSAASQRAASPPSLSTVTSRP